MENSITAYPPIDYHSAWMIIGFFVLFLVVIWYISVLWFTRKKKIRSITTLTPLTPVRVDTAALQQKYLALIDSLEVEYRQKKLKSRTVHQRLSILLRFFAYEASGIRAFALTLQDLRKTRYNQLTTAIETYYKPEFSEVMNGDVPTALQTAREVVKTWS